MRTAAVATTAALLLAGCGSAATTLRATPSPTSTADAVRSGQVTVDIANFAYRPATLTVRVGTTVTWDQQDTTVHTVTTQRGDPVAFDSGALAQGATYRHTFTAPGSYAYVCTIHPFMTGTVRVVS